MKMHQGWIGKTRQDMVNDGGQGVEARYRIVNIDTPTEVTVWEVPEEVNTRAYPNGTPLFVILAPESEFLNIIPRDHVFDTRYEAIGHMLNTLNTEQQSIQDRYQALVRQLD